MCVCLCICVCANVVFGKVSGCQGVLRLFPSPLCQHCVHARLCACVCAPALRWVMTQRKDSEHTVLNSTEGPRDKYNSAQCFFLCGSLSYNSFIISFLLAFISAHHSPTVHFIHVHIRTVHACACVRSSLPNKGTYTPVGMNKPV